MIRNYNNKKARYFNVLEMKNGKNIPNKTPSTSESISVSDVLYQLSSLRKVSTYINPKYKNHTKLIYVYYISR